MKRALAERAKAESVEEHRAAVPLPAPSIPTHPAITKNGGAGVSVGVGVHPKVGMNISLSAPKLPRKIPRTKPPRSSPTKPTATATPVPPPQSMPSVPRGVGKRSRPSKGTPVAQLSTPVESSTAQIKVIQAAGESIIARVVNQGPTIKTNIPTTTNRNHDRKIRTPSSSIDSNTRTKSPTNNISSKRRNAPALASPSKRPRKSPSGKNSHHKNTSNSNNATPSTLPLHTIHSDDETTHSAASGGGDQQSSNGGFYLKHQNRALTAELHTFKHSVRALEAEREVRRRECLSIGEALRRLEGFWREMEVVVLEGLIQWKLRDLGPPTTCTSTKECFNIAPPSTGMGKDVETITTILDTLTALAHSSILPPPISKSTMCSEISSSSIKRDEVAATGESSGSIDEEADEDVDIGGNEVEENYQIYLKSLSDATTSFSDRCCQFQQLLLRLVRHMWSSSTQVHRDKDFSEQQHQRQEEVFGAASLHKQIATLQTTCARLENQVKELVKARDGAIVLERRVRKGLYRLASGRMKIGEVLKTVEKEGSSSRDLVDVEEKALPPKLESPSVKDETSAAIPGADVAATIKLDGKILGMEDVLKMKKEIADLGLVAELREKQIMELLNKKERCEKRINELLTKDADLEAKQGSSISDDDVKLSALYIGISSKLSATEREVQSLKNDLTSVKNRWGVTKGDLELARKNVADLTEKHFRRLRELAGEPDLDVIDDLYDNTSAIISNGDKQHIQNAKKFTEVEHKLKHALDNVRQAEAIRMSLAESNMMNVELQNKLEELKVKNSTLLATKAEARTKSADLYAVSSMNTSHKQLRDASTHRESSSSSISMQEKMRLMKKQLSAATNSKEQAKGKQERAEKERDVLMKTNARLIKQIQEKDDMNAKSLSTILHLKQLSEQLVEQKDILEKKLKGTQQLEIASRLAANAKERVEEEATREMETYQDEVKRVKVSLESSIKEKEEFYRLLTETKAKVVTVTENLSIIRNRCDELVNSSTDNEKEKKKLNEALAIARNEADEAIKKAKRVVVDSASPSARVKGSKFENNFSNEDLSKLVRVLKDRLMCPVCNTRDKEVILLRCRHMFCRQCVDINIKNRSRKCPACAQRFDMKDVEDVWL